MIMVLGLGIACGPLVELEADPNAPPRFMPPCNPAQDSGRGDQRCCSDDPSTLSGELPAYQGLEIPGSAPSFSERNNDLSRFGRRLEAHPRGGEGLLAAGVEDCPIPCNPTWPDDAIDSVCGLDRECCQTVELDPKDCVIDSDTGRYRPVTGEDIGELTFWRSHDHVTHQDPDGNACLQLAQGNISNPEFTGCVRHLTVANQRGFCTELGADQQCPQDQPGYVDPCEQLNGG